jgi:hypothetical protein
MMAETAEQGRRFCGAKVRGPRRANGQPEEAVFSLKEGGTTGGSEVAGIH